MHAQTEEQLSPSAAKLASVLWSKENLIPMRVASFRKNTLGPMIEKGLSHQAADETELALKRFLEKLSTEEKMIEALALALDEAFSREELNIFVTKGQSAKEIASLTASKKFLD